MVEENITQEFKLKNIYETRDYFLEEIEKNELICRKHKKGCANLSYIDTFFSMLASTITG